MPKGTISWFSNSPSAPTGYGVQTAQVVKRLAKDGYDVAILSNYGREGVNGKTQVGSFVIPEYARGAETYSQDITPLNHAHHKASHPNQADALITLYDVWIMKGKKYDDINIGSWVPVDHHPCPPLVLEWLAKPNVTPIAMSRYGQKQIQDHGVDAEYVPHAFEPVFKPTKKLGEQTVREYMNLSESEFVVGMNAANKANGLVHRKALAENLLAFSIFAKNKPDAVLYLHMDMFGAYGGWRIEDLLQSVGLNENQVVFVDQIAYRYGISQTVLAGIYSAMDVYLGTSYGEGFGVGTIEAQACGTPVIVSDFAASAELVGDGWKVQGQPFWDHHQRAWFNVPSIPAIVDALEQAYNRGRGLSTKAMDFAKDYSADAVYKAYWQPVLERLLK
jgi:glycosyltransferase involved in cell wall biosynthesis